LHRSGYLIALLLCSFLAGCATEAPKFRLEAQSTLQRVKKEGGRSLRPSEFRSTEEALGRADSFLKDGERKEAESYFYLSLLKAQLLEREVGEQKALLEEQRRRAEEQKRAELERMAREQEKRLAQAKAEALAQREAAEVARRKAKPQPQKERVVLVSSYTVTRGESLPFIASQPQVYGDRTLWPLIYRANRDQISDPRHIWPGQVLRIPRNIGREDVAEARRYAQERGLH
jgi:nucleoid-associated protein YgaU